MLRFYNTLTKKISDFKPLKDKLVTFYSCGPTVYDYPHIGNLRRYITDDVMHRYLLAKDFKVKRIVNITDVGHLTQDEYDTGEDKVIVAARREGKSPLAIAKFYEKKFLENAQELNLIKPLHYTRASQHIKDMQKVIKTLLTKGYAYIADGSVYYDVEKFKDYGQLSGNTLSNLRQMVRPELNKAAFKNKKSAEDFVLWVKAKPQHLLKWSSPWSTGYPGWHIECAAMILKHLGTTIDIHSGGQDNIFPHHEDEIAEAKAATGKKLADYWLHTGYLVVNNKKMSKSAGSTIRLADLIAKKFNPLAFRYLVLNAHFTSRLNFTWAAMRSAQEGWLNIVTYYEQLKQSHPKSGQKLKKQFREDIKKIHQDFFAAIEDNLNTPQALAALAHLMKLGHTVMSQSDYNIAAKKLLIKTFDSLETILGLLPAKLLQEHKSVERSKVLALIKKRESLKLARKYPEADNIRKKIIKLGYLISDLPTGTRWTERTSGQTGIVKK